MWYSHTPFPKVAFAKIHTVTHFIAYESFARGSYSVFDHVQSLKISVCSTLYFVLCKLIVVITFAT